MGTATTGNKTCSTPSTLLVAPAKMIGMARLVGTARQSSEISEVAGVVTKKVE